MNVSEYVALHSLDTVTINNSVITCPLRGLATEKIEMVAQAMFSEYINCEFGGPATLTLSVSIPKKEEIVAPILAEVFTRILRRPVYAYGSDLFGDHAYVMVEPGNKGRVVMAFVNAEAIENGS